MSNPRSFPEDFARSLPKAELHVHLEGTVDAETVLVLADRHGVEPPAPDIASLYGWYRFDDFPMFLERYFAVLSLLRSPEDFGLVAARYLEQAAAHGVAHVEFHVSATGHIVENGKRWAPIHDGIIDGMVPAASRLGITVGLIPDISPHLPASACADAMEQVFAHDLDHIVAIGMGGPADTWRTDDFANIFARARGFGIPGVSHAGEHGGAWEVQWALEEFQAVRIQHGIGALQDAAVTQMLVDRSIACDVCPGSNLALKAVASAEAHPLPQMLEAGVAVTLGTDDPPMFQTSLIEEYRRAWEWCDLGQTDLVALAANSIRHSFASEQRKAELLAALHTAADLAERQSED